MICYKHNITYYLNDCPECLKEKYQKKTKTDEAESEVRVEAKVKPESTDIEKQENIVTILYEFIDNMIKDDAYKDYQKGYSTHGIREAVGTALEKILKLDNLKIREVQ